MQIEVLLFAAARDAAGADSIEVDISETATAADVITAIGTEIPTIESLLPACRLAIDCEYVPANARVDQSGEIALIPPVSGG